MRQNDSGVTRKQNIAVDESDFDAECEEGLGDNEVSAAQIGINGFQGCEIEQDDVPRPTRKSRICVRVEGDEKVQRLVGVRGYTRTERVPNEKDVRGRVNGHSEDGSTGERIGGRTGGEEGQCVKKVGQGSPEASAGGECELAAAGSRYSRREAKTAGKLERSGEAILTETQEKKEGDRRRQADEGGPRWLHQGCTNSHISSFFPDYRIIFALVQTWKTDMNRKVRLITRLAVVGEEISPRLSRSDFSLVRRGFENRPSVIAFKKRNVIQNISLRSFTVDGN
jgi:hypothetical protein